ncbi:MAG: hypothetical protein LBC39_08055 [Methanobrevibacter sp.]|jgi:adenine-specific DNA-methyltransferase|nr:hypothetical protein [Candidatus Methanovirga aequatorialis]
MNKIIKIPYQDIFIDNKIYFSKINGLLKKILSSGINKHAICKNGYATLNDNVFIKDNFPDEIQPLIRVLKGSTGKYKFCIYPYNKDGKLIGFDMLNNNTREYLEKNLKKDRTDWFGFGRTQALKDTYKNKIAISSLIKSKDSLKIKKLEKGEGVYSGLYIITDKEFSQIQKALINPIFVKFVESLRKYKNGGFYTFNTSDVTKYLNYYFENGGINE